MNIEIDHECGAAYVRVAKGKIAVTKEYTQNIIVDCDNEGKVLGVEFIDYELDKEHAEELVQKAIVSVSAKSTPTTVVPA